MEEDWRNVVAVYNLGNDHWQLWWTFPTYELNDNKQQHFSMEKRKGLPQVHIESHQCSQMKDLGLSLANCNVHLLLAPSLIKKAPAIYHCKFMKLLFLGLS